MTNFVNFVPDNPLSLAEQRWRYRWASLWVWLKHQNPTLWMSEGWCRRHDLRRRPPSFMQKLRKRWHHTVRRPAPRR